MTQAGGQRAHAPPPDSRISWKFSTDTTMTMTKSDDGDGGGASALVALERALEDVVDEDHGCRSAAPPIENR